jgi:hypothetical protein
METYNQAQPNGADEGDDMGMDVPDQPKDESRTALLPLDFFQTKELKPGAVCKIKISRILDGQAEVTYVRHEEAPAPGEEEEELVEDPEMAAYMNE